MSNKDLLKQAIAEAKTIREAAIANAKEALEESLTPHLKEMLAQKLQEMEEEDVDMEENVNEEDMMNDPEGESAHGNVAEAEEEEEEAEEGEEAEEEAGEEGEEGEEEEIEIEDMSIDDLKDLIRDIVAQEVGHDESEEEVAGEEAPEGEDLTGMDSDEEEIDINELLAELAEEDKEEENLDEAVFGVDVIAQLIDMFPFLTNSTAEMLLGAFGAVGLTTFAAIAAKVQEMALKGNFGDSAKAFAEKLQKSGKDAFNVTQQKEGAEEEMEEGLGDTIKGGLDKFDKWIGSTSDKMKAAGEKSKVVQALEKGVDKAQDKAKELGLTGHGMTKGHKITNENEELEEALATVEALRGQLQEVNLLNAKLLYVNKVFKSNNLSEGQKVNVIAAFDKAETVKEVKLVFETVSKNVVAKPAAIKEHRSFASRATGNAQTTAPKEIISEVSEQVARWQKLAGII